MDQLSQMPNQELPRPEKVESMPRGNEYVAPYPEQLEQHAPGERISQAASAVSQAAAASDPITIPLPSAAVQTGQSTVPDPAVVNPVVADDADLIEKEWIDKAKDIVAKTKSDPHMQSVELTNFRHDYMKKRYGKEIKLPSDKAT